MNHDRTFFGSLNANEVQVFHLERMTLIGAYPEYSLFWLFWIGLFLQSISLLAVLCHYALQRWHVNALEFWSFELCVAN